MDDVQVDGRLLAGVNLSTEHSVILAIRAERGLLGCGYLSIETADRLGDALAVVRGVRSYEDMLSAEVVATSRRAAKLGVTPGCTGLEALRILVGDRAG